MQTAIDCNGSSTNSTSITTTTTAVIVDFHHSEDSHALSGPAVATATVTLTAAESANVLRHRLTPSKPTTNYSFTSQHLFDGTECQGSNVEQLSATPSPSPQPSTKRKCKATTATAGAVTTTATPTQVTASNAISMAECTACSKTNSNSLSNPTTSSVIATPILARNGNASLPDSASGIASLKKIAIAKNDAAEHHHQHSSTEPKENSLCCKQLPLPAQSQYFFGSDAITELSISPSPTSSKTQSSNLSVTTTLASSSSSKSKPKEQLLQWKDMPEYLQFNPYVLNGYRPLQTFKGCLLSLFYWHNETINILTHAIPIVYILAFVPGLMPWDKGYRFLSFCHVFGSVAPWCGSFVYHLFMNIEKGEKVYYRLLKLDMLGIWVSQSFGALPLVTATTFCFSFKWKWLVIISYCLLALWGLYKALTASSPWQRRLCFALPFTMRSILTFLRTIGLVGGNRVALSHVYLQDGVSILGGAIGAMRIPEKWFPGLVDYYLNSHNIMHVLVVVAVYSMYKATIKDIEWMNATTCHPFTNETSAGIESTFTTNYEL